MEDVARDQHEVRLFLDDQVDRTPRGTSHIGLALIVACRAQPLELAETQVQVGEVGDAHGGR